MGLASRHATVVGGLTWNPSDKDAGITLSGGNLIANGSGGGQESVRANSVGHNTGKWWHSQTISILGSECYIGNADAASTPPGPGGINNGVIEQSSGDVISNGSRSSGLFSALALHDVVEVCEDVGAKKVWFRVNGGNWNGSPTANPTTGVGGLATNPTGASIKPYFCSSTSSSQVTANFAGPSPVSGFSIWS